MAQVGRILSSCNSNGIPCTKATEAALKLAENVAAQAQGEISSKKKKYRCMKAADPEAGMLSFGTMYVKQTARTAF